MYLKYHHRSSNHSCFIVPVSSEKLAGNAQGQSGEILFEISTYKYLTLERKMKGIAQRNELWMHL